MFRITFRHISTGIAQDWLIRANLYSPYINFGQTLQTYINLPGFLETRENEENSLCQPMNCDNFCLCNQESGPRWPEASNNDRFILAKYVCEFML